MTNAIVQALEQAAQKLADKLGGDGAEAVEKLYRITGRNAEDILERTEAVDQANAEKIGKLLKQMGEKADKAKDPANSLDKATQLRDQAELRKNLAKILVPDSEAAQAAAADYRRAYDNFKQTRDLTNLKLAGSGATMSGSIGAGWPAKMNARGRIDTVANMRILSARERDERLRTATRSLGDEALGDQQLTGRMPTCAAGLLSGNTITMHTSLKTSASVSEPNIHPALQRHLNRLSSSTITSDGHGRCGEVGALSDLLWQKDPHGTTITSQNHIRNAVGENGQARMFSTVIGDQTVQDNRTDGYLPHGTYLPPCATCGQMMHDFGIAFTRAT
jgi:hypothetical protein